MKKCTFIRFFALLCTLLLTCATAVAEPKVFLPEEYTKNGTLPVYYASERDLLPHVDPAFFNQSGIVETKTGKNDYHAVTFADGAILEWDKNSLNYNTHDGFGEIVHEDAMTGEKYTELRPKPDIANAAASLAGWMHYGWPKTGEVFTLQSETLPGITLEQAKAKTDQLLAMLGLDGYVCETALDMDMSRIREMGDRWNALIDEGYMLNCHRLDYSAATQKDEGYMLLCNRYGSTGDVDGFFYVNVYVTSEGFAWINLHDRYAAGDICSTPASLVSWESVAEALPREMAESRLGFRLEEIYSVRLAWCPVRAADAKDGMVLTPAWILDIRVSSDEPGEEGDGYYAIFNAVDGKLINGNWI